MAKENKNIMTAEEIVVRRDKLNELLSKKRFIRNEKRKEMNYIEGEIQQKYQFFYGLKKKINECEINGETKKVGWYKIQKIEIYYEIESLKSAFEDAKNKFNTIDKEIKNLEKQIQHLYITKDEERLLIITFQNERISLDIRNEAAGKLFEALDLLIRSYFYKHTIKFMAVPRSYEDSVGEIYEKFVEVLKNFKLKYGARFFTYFQKWLAYPQNLFKDLPSEMCDQEIPDRYYSAESLEGQREAIEMIKLAKKMFKKKRRQKSQFIDFVITGMTKRDAAIASRISQDCATDWFAEFKENLYEVRKMAA